MSPLSTLRSDRTSPVGRLALALLVSVLAGLVVAALAFPLIGAPALAAKSTAEDFLELPAELQQGDPAAITRILDSNGNLVATLYRENRVPVQLSVVPKHVRDAVLAIEDSRFYEHNGVDVKGTLRAAVRTSTGEVQGGSTITQQYVKNALLLAASDEAGQEAATEQTISRKLKEARYALALEEQLSKDQILERYLNIAYFGNGAYGIAAAAKYYFGKPVQKLTIAQGAMLAGMVQNPSRFDPTDAEKAPGVVQRRNLVMRRMADLEMISRLTYQQGSALPLALNVTRTGDSCDSEKVLAPFFCDYVRTELENTDVGAALGKTREERQSKLLGGGLIIRTSLDLKVQEAADRAAYGNVPADDPSGARVAVDVVEPGTGHIKALAVNQPYGEGEGQTKVNFTTGGSFGFQPGSTFKTFVLADAVRQGIPLSTTLFSPATYESDEFKNCTADRGCIPYEVDNAEDSETGTFDVPEATHLSVNTFYIQLLERTGIDGPAEIAEALGLRRVRNPEGELNAPLDRVPSFVLGTNEVSPLAMAGAYAAFAAHGEYCRPQAVLSITTLRGQEIDVPEPRCSQVLEPSVADAVTDVLRGVIDGPNPKTGARARLGRPTAGKTGTTDSSRAAWFVGYTPQLSTAVWVGMPDPEKGAPLPMRRVSIGGRYYPQVYGGTIPADVFQETMLGALEGEPVLDFDEPAPSDLPEGETKPVPDLRGQSVEEALRTLEAEGFVGADAGRSDADWVPVGTVAFSSPGRGDPAAVGSTVQVFTANGRPRD